VTSYSAIDASRFSAWEEGSGSALWWSVALLIAAVSTVDAALIASYFYLRQSATVWPPAFLGIPHLFWPVLGTGLRTASEPLMFLSNRAARDGHRGRLLLYLGVSIVLLIGWMIEVLEYAFSRNFGWVFGAYESCTWILEAFSFVVAGSLVIWALVAWFWVWQGRFTEQRRAGLQALKLAWTSQFVAWIFVWLVAYFGPIVFRK
jgi:heme/copper-type cytochrome/quinol oxidase subunit 3